jgi:hypothetical protein
MAVFRPGRTVITRRPFVTVDGGLRPGRYYFQLVVVDEQGNRSRMDQVLVSILKNNSRTVAPFPR